MILYHGSKEVVEYPEIRKARFNKDFYFGFYCTNIEKQAERWAIRYGKKGYINKYEYTENQRLNILKFDKMTEEWLDFIISCRKGQAHQYDIVESKWILSDIIDKNKDSLRFYYLGNNYQTKIEHVGIERGIPVDQPLIM